MRFLSAVGSKRFLCLDWDVRGLRVVEMAASRAGVRVLHAMQAAVPPDVQVNAADSVGRFIRETLRSGGVRSSPLIVDVPRQDAVLNLLSVPRAADHELASMVRFQIAKELPFSMDQGVVDFAVLGPSETDGKSLQILVAAIRRHVLEYYQAVAEAAGLELCRVGLRPFANVYALSRTEASLEGRVVLVDVGPAMTEIDVLRNGRLVFSRAAAVNVQASRGAAGAEGGPHNGADIIPFRPSSVSPASSVDELLVEVTRTVEAYRSGDPGARIDRFLVAGSCGVEKDLSEALGRRFDVPTSIYAPPKDVERQVGRRAKVDWTGFGAALGLAWGHGQAAVNHFDFLHPKEPVNVTREKLRRVPVLAALVSLAVLAAAAGAYLKVNDRAKTLAQYAKTVEDEEKISEERQAFMAVVEAAERWRQESILWLDQLRAVGEALRDNKNAYVRELSTTEKGEIILKLVGKNADAFARLGDDLADLKTPGGKPRFVVVPGTRSPSSDSEYPVQTEIRLLVANRTPPPPSATRPAPATPPADRDEKGRIRDRSGRNASRA